MDEKKIKDFPEVYGEIDKVSEAGNIPARVTEEEDILEKYGNTRKLNELERKIYELYKDLPLLSYVAESLGMKLEDILNMKERSKNLSKCLGLAEMEFRDKIEHKVMSRAGMFGEEELANNKRAYTKELLALIASKDSRFSNQYQKREEGKDKGNTYNDNRRVVIVYEQPKADKNMLK